MNFTCALDSLLILLVGCLLCCNSPASAQGLTIQQVESNFEFMKVQNAVDVGEHSFIVASQHISSTSGVHYIYLQQTWDGVPLDGAIINIGRSSTGDLHIFGSRLVSNEVRKSQIIDWRNAQELQAIALRKIKAEHSRSKLAIDRIQSKHIWYQQGDLWIPACEIRFSDRQGPWRVVVNLDGQEIVRQSLVLRCNHGVLKQRIGVKSSCLAIATISSASDQSYLVYPLGTAGPHTSIQEVIINPADPVASPFGWHDTSSTPIPDFTDTRGNNTYVQEDRAGINESGIRPSGGANLKFDFAHQADQHDSAQLDAALTNLFYWVNVNHDILYHYGFDEAAGNFQFNNYERGGLAGDQLIVDGFDGAFRNNAIFFPAPDGQTSRLETSFWSGSIFDAEVLVGSSEVPALILPAVESQFSMQNQLRDLPLVQGEVVYIDDAGGNRTACQASSIIQPQRVAGKIAIVDRGSCFFTQKAQIAQSLGAIGLIVVQNESVSPFPMGGSDGSITIPAVMVSRSIRDQLLDLIESQPDIVFSMGSRESAPARAASLDNAVITHEYAHGLTTRLTGGKHTIDCLLNQEQMSEGTSDYIGLMFTTDWSNVLSSDAFGFATYLTGELVNGAGIRSHAYSKDLLINPLTYEDLPLLTVSHGVGTLWAAILWDMTWNMIEENGVTTDMYQGQAGNTDALRIVVEAQKLQLCNPGFVDARDALLEAATLLDLERYHFAIWRAFARRGVGIDADQRDHNNKFDGVAGFTLPIEFQSLIDDFQVRVLNGSASINWTMLQEFGSSRFFVEKSVADGPYSKVSEQAAANISLEPTAYGTVDVEKLEDFALHRFRLGLEDIDGKITYIANDSLRIIPTDDLAIYPNPASDRIEIFVGSDFPEIKNIRLLNVQGLEIDSRQVTLESGQSSSYKIPDVASGIYFLEATTGEMSVVRKVNIQ